MTYSAPHDAMAREIAAEMFGAASVEAGAFYRMMRQESDTFDLDVIECRRFSKSGAAGIAQLIPKYHPIETACDPPAALRYAAAFFRWLLTSQGSVRAAVAAYNHGPVAVRALRDAHGADWERHLPQEPTDYLRIVLGNEGTMTLTRPPMTQIPGHPDNRYPTRNGFRPEAIVPHTMGGTLAACDAWFRDPAARAGTHFGVGRGGEIHQYHPVATAPFANGAIEDGYRAALIDANGGANPNFWTVSIEHDDEGRGAPPTAAQFEASAQLAAWLIAVVLPEMGMAPPIDRTHILSHSDISPRSRPRCNGWGEALMATYIARVGAIVAAARPDPAPAPTPVPDPTPAPTHEREYLDALTVQAAALGQWGPYVRDLAAYTARVADALAIQQANLDRIIGGQHG